MMFDRRRPFNRQGRPNLSRIFFVGAATLAFVVVAVSGFMEYRGTRVIIDEFATARQDSNTIVALNDVLADVLSAETGQRGLMMTGDRKYLGPYRRGVEHIEADLRRVDQLTSQEPDQQARLRVLRSAISSKLAELDQTIRVHDASGQGAAMAIVASGRGRDDMSAVRRAIDAMRTVEEREREVSRVNADNSSARVLKGIAVGTCLAAVLLLLTFVQFGIASRASQRAREESESANRLKDQFIATVSHELRTPLTAILGWAAILRDDHVDPQTLDEGLATIQRSAYVQKKLIEDLLDVSRIQTGKLRLSMRTLDLSDVIRGAIESMRPAADARSLRITTAIEAGLRISGDPDRLQQIMWNLMTNAVKFTPKGGEIAINVTRADSHVVIEVRDTGDGIDLSFLPHVFQPFRQSDSSRARVHKGLGLGLSIVKYLVEAHGGSVSVWSAGNGKGTTFRVSLPIMPIVHGEMSDETALPIANDVGDIPITLPSPHALRGLKIMVVDDHEPTRGILSFVLQRSGGEVVSASGAAAAMTLFRAQRPDVMVSDIGMPDEDGLTLLERIRKLPASAGGETPAIALTAYVRREDSERLLGGGFQAYLTKPVEPVELVNAICEIAAGCGAHQCAPDGTQTDRDVVARTDTQMSDITLQLAP
jgi:CHASE3 domain sensor protein/CheY-like chemotaxis protein/two-component sensor histidine kinase